MKKLILCLLPLGLAACSSDTADVCDAASDGLDAWGQAKIATECLNEAKLAEHRARQAVAQKYREMPRVETIQNQRPTQE